MFKYLLFAALLIIQTQLWAREIGGFVQSGNQKLSGVIVTDGTHFTQTDTDGTFQFDVSDTADFVYIFTPSGYTAPFKSGTPQFYQSLKDSASTFSFNLEKLPFDADNYALLAIADPQTKTLEQFARFERESVPDLKASIAAYQARQTNTVGIALGDIAWDELELFDNFKQAMAGLNIPFYPVVGNHDHDLNATDDYASAEVYRRQFGPTYYGFNLSNHYYLVLDDIVYKGNKSYDEDLTDEQLEWVKNYLQYVPKGSTLVIAMHAPFKNVQKDQMIPHGQKLLDICKDYQLSFISGHTHLNSNVEVAPGVMEHNIGAICGTWWTAETCRDGTPNGYQVFEGTTDQLSWYYKSVGKDRNYQLVLFDKGNFVNQANAVVAKIWNWDSNWKVEWFEDGKAKGEMKQVSAQDPEYLRYLQQRSDKGKKEVPAFKRSVESFFYFTAYPSLDAKKVKVVATDRFGNSYEQEIELRSIDVQAHRGGTGLMPENTTEAMLNAVEMGVNTLELDLRITEDNQVIVAHDAYFKSAYTKKPDGTPLTETEAKGLVFYRMNYADIAQYDTGSSYYAKYPEQQKLKTYIPLLSALIDSVENYASNNNLGPVQYNIEIKSDESLELQKLIPEYKTFTDKAMEVLQRKKLGDRLLVQSFDTRTLNYLHNQYPGTRLAYLVANTETLEQNLAKLSFTPDVYSPNFISVNQSLIKICRDAGMKVVPWTVDDKTDIQRIIDMQVDGIISNYPNRVLSITRGY
ncbi:MAG: calcineurin-like phosphoesterase C-terminal domain-containing protein [Mangrovibacterium sp.]